MPMAWTFRFLEDIAPVDIGFEAEGESVEEVFRGATQAFLESTATPSTLSGRWELHSAGDLGVGKSLFGSPGGLERRDIRSGHGGGARHHRPRANRGDGALRFAWVRPSVLMSGLAEAAGLAYKEISEVVESADCAGITKKVAELHPIGNIKG